MVRNGIPRVCFYFCSTERNSVFFSLPRKGSERNSESMLLFLFHGTEFRVVFSSVEGSEWNSERFLFRRTVGIPSEINICSVNSIYCGIIFLVGNSQPYIGLLETKCCSSDSLRPIALVCYSHIPIVFS
jgi:hypothetical protein